MNAKHLELKKQRFYCLTNMEYFKTLIEDYEKYGSPLGVDFCKAQIEFHQSCLESCRTDFVQIDSELAALDN